MINEGERNEENGRQRDMRKEELKVVRNEKVGGQESANLSQFGSERGDRGSFLYQFCRRL